MKLKIPGAFLLLIFCMLLLCSCQNSDNPVSVPSPSQTLPPSVSTTPSPSPENSLAPTQEIEESPIPEATEGPAPEASASTEPTPSPEILKEQLDAYFDRSVFVGDSIMEGIRQYVAKNRSVEPTLGSAQFLTSTMGVSVTTLLYERQYGPYYRYGGTEQFLLDILPQLGCDRVFLMLGLNDLGRGLLSTEEILSDYASLIEVLQQTVPGAEIIVITCSPKVASSWLPDYISNRNYNNALISEFVNALMDMCSELEIACIDIHTPLKNEKGALPDEYCRDGFVHLNNTGSEIVVEELYRFAAQRHQQEEP